MTSSTGTLKHLAVIMDGNGRWAERRGLPRSAGHRAGVEAVRRLVRTSQDRGIAHLTVFAFSRANWARPIAEVKTILLLLETFLLREARALADAGIRLRVLGDRTGLPPALKDAVREAEQTTRYGRRMTLTVAVSYSGRGDMAAAARAAVEAVESGEARPDEIDEAWLARRLGTRDLPDPDLVIRTGGERRLSDFLLWQAAFAELWFTDVLWPDFGARDLDAALADFSARSRRFGGLNSPGDPHQKGEADDEAARQPGRRVLL